MVDDRAYSASHAVFAGEPRKVLVRVRIVFLELLDDILAHISVILLDLFGTAVSILNQTGVALHAILTRGGSR
jgi:hypothetical protein